MTGEHTYPPVPVTVSGDKGYVWDAEGVKWLRQHCRIVGGMAGSSAEQKQHKSAGGLPCELKAEELALAVQKGWVTIIQSNPSYAEGALTPPSVAGLQAPAWLTAVLNKKPVALSTRVTRQLSSGSGVIFAPQTATSTDTSSPISCKSAVLSSLHENGYFVTDGSKFGSEYLLYPGDPLLYHAQFTVQVLDNQAAIKPALLVGGARGSHSARKHLLLASIGAGGVSYITVGPEGGFGSTG